MASSNTHIILRKVLEFTIPKNQNAFQFQKDIGELCRTKLEPALEKLFDRYSTPDEILQLDLLEVDIGRQRLMPSGDAFVEVVVKAIEEKLKSTIRNGNGEITRKPVEQSIFEEWVYFLECGYFPSYNSNPDLEYYQLHIPEILSREFFLKERLMELFRSSFRSVERLIKQHPEAFLIKLFAELTENPDSRIEEYHKEVKRLIIIANASTHQKVLSVRPKFWEWIFRNFKSNPDIRFEEKNFIIGLFEYWLNGESSLRETIIKILNKNSESFPLISELKNKLEVIVVSDRKDTHKPNLDFFAATSVEGSHSMNEKDDAELSKQSEDDKHSEKANTNLNQEQNKIKAEGLSDKKTKEKEKQTGKYNREKELKKYRDEQKVKDFGSPNEVSHLDDRKSYKDHPNEKPIKGAYKKEILLEEFPSDEKASEHREGIFWYINYAGVVLLHTFLPVFFEKCELTRKKQFIDEAARERAAQLVLYLATGKEETPEFDLVLAKFICGIPMEVSMSRMINLSETEKSESIKLLQAAIDHWEKLKKTSPDGLREGFLQRQGKLEKRSQGWYLTVEQKSIDVLLNYLPWNLRMIKLPWMEQLLRVEWD